MRLFPLAGPANAPLLILVASVVTAVPTASAQIYAFIVPVLTNVTLAPGSYDIVATRAGGGLGFQGTAAGRGAIVEGTFTLVASEPLRILVGG